MAAEADFLSIGTNDLAQYVLAADRTDAEVEPYYKPFAPAVLRMVKLCVDAAVGAGKPVTVCGEIAGDPAGAALLVGLGVRELSMSPILVPAVAKALGELHCEKLEKVAQRALRASESDEVELILAGLRRRIQ
jgi:phosphoenolpyruvate-protein kinase (PTS system EI component)